MSLADYARFVDSHRGRPSADPYFGEATVRFAVREDDVLVLPGEVTVKSGSCGAVLQVPGIPGSLTVCGVSPADVEAVVGGVDGRATLGDVLARARAPREAALRVVSGAFGRLLFAPLAVGELEERVSFTELVRYPGSPYEVVREYWENQADVAGRLRDESPPASGQEFVAWLRSLHVTLLTGRSGRSFYIPASPVVAKSGVVPGELAGEASVTEAGAMGVRFVAGLRVNAAPIGGAWYPTLLAESVGDPGSLLPDRDLGGEGEEEGVGPSWGRLVTALSGDDAAPRRWFCPPRPILDAHMGALSAALAEALGLAARPGVLPGELAGPLSRLHQGLVRLHPFRAGNQSLAMALVNQVLRRAVGGGLPHLVLDHLALSLSGGAYERVFSRALHAWLLPLGTDRVTRARELSSRRSRAFELLRRLGAATDPSEAHDVIQEEPEGARLLFLEPRVQPQASITA